MAIRSPSMKRLVLLFATMPTFSAFAADLSAQSATKPRVLVTISKDTTYITEPLRPDGYPDYVAALNQRCSEGVTPENNAAVLFWKAMGPSAIREEDRTKYFQMLGIPPLPEKGDYFVTSDEWFKRQKTKEKKKPDQPEPDSYNDPLWQQQTQAMERPWSKQEFPVWAEWLATNEKPLKLLVEASKRPRRYDPMVFGENGTLYECVLSPTVSTSRDVARALAARAMSRLNEGKVNQAWADLMACHRLGRLMGQGPTLVEMLVGITIDGMACAGDRRLLQYSNLSAAQLAKMRDDLPRLPPLPKMIDKIEPTERFFGLEGVSTAAREGPAGLWKLTGGVQPGGAVELLADTALSARLNWDIVLRMLNSSYDRLVDAMRKPTRAGQMEAMEQIDKDIHRLSQKTAKDWVTFGISVLAEPSKAVSEQFGANLIVLSMPAFSGCVNAEDRGTMQFELTKLAFALAQYRAEHGSYPAKLADLKPKYVAEVPKDIFNDAALHYRPAGGGYLLYSVGQNGKDDGGKGPEDAKEGEGWDDLAIRMPAAKKEDKKT